MTTLPRSRFFNTHRLGTETPEKALLKTQDLKCPEGKFDSVWSLMQGVFEGRGWGKNLDLEGSGFRNGLFR